MDTEINTKYSLITRNLKEIIGEENIKGILEKEQFKLYWGTAPTGRIHIGYFVPFLKIADFLDAGCNVKILIADLHAYLDNMKSSIDQLENRCIYYKNMIMVALGSLGVNTSNLEFINGTSYQLSKEYTMDVYKMNSMLTVNTAKRGGAEVVKYSDNPLMTGLLYPSLQALDEHYLDVHGELGGYDQRKIFGLANNYMPKLGYKKCIYFMNDMVPGLRFEKMVSDNNNTNDQEYNDDNMLKYKLEEILNNPQNIRNKLTEILKTNDENLFSNKMSSSNNDTKIDLLDEPNVIKKKINQVYCLPIDDDDNSLMPLLEKIIFPVLYRKNINFIVKRKEKFGGNIEYNNFLKLKNDYRDGILHPGDLKPAVIDSINFILNPIREQFNDIILKNIVKKAYC